MSLRGLPFLSGNAKRHREWKAACVEVHTSVDGYIECALSEHIRSQKRSRIPQSIDAVEDAAAVEEERPISFLHELVKETQDRQFIRDQIISVFFPARDATAIAISDCFFLLARHPQVWTRLRVEVLGHHELTTFESLKSMKYLQAVLNESK